jgi:hypothetical protein
MRAASRQDVLRIDRQDIEDYIGEAYGRTAELIAEGRSWGRSRGRIAEASIYLLEPVGSRLRVFEAVAAVSVAAMRWHARFAQRCLIRAGFGFSHNHGRAASATYDDVLHDYLCSPCCRLGSAYPARDQGKADALRKGRDGDGYQVTQRISK